MHEGVSPRHGPQPLAPGGQAFCSAEGNVAVAQQDPIAILNKHKDRVIALHVKDVAKRTAADKDPPSVALGEGVVDWKSVIGTAKKNGTKSFFYEQEEPFTRPILDSVKISGDFLTKLKI